MNLCEFFFCIVQNAGDMYELGSDIGKYYSVNVPLREGIDDHCKCFCLTYVNIHTDW